MMGSSLFTWGWGLSDVALLSIVCFGVTLIFSLVQLVKFTSYAPLTGSVQDGTCCIPWTVQKQVHLIIFLAMASRVAFFVVAIYVWDGTGGIVSTDILFLREVFYVLDGLPIILHFSAAMTVALFWAQIQHDVEEPRDEVFRRHVCEGMVIQLLRRLQLLAYVGLAVLLALDVTPLWDTTDYYVNGTCALYVSVLYVLASAVLAWYARVMVRSVTQVPIEVYVRKRKQREILTTSLLLVVALLVRVALLLTVVANRDLVLDTWQQWVAAFLYYWMLENVPALVLLWYFHRTPAGGREVTMLLPHEDKGALAGLLGGTVNKPSLLLGRGSQHQHVSEEMIEASLKRLAMLHLRNYATGLGKETMDV